MPYDPLTAPEFQILIRTRTKVVRVGFDDTRPDVPQATLEVFTPQAVPVGITLSLEAWDVLVTALDGPTSRTLYRPLILCNTRARVVRAQYSEAAGLVTVEELCADAPAQLITLPLETWDLLAMAITAHRTPTIPPPARRPEALTLDTLRRDLRDLDWDEATPWPLRMLQRHDSGIDRHDFGGGLAWPKHAKRRV